MVGAYLTKQSVIDFIRQDFDLEKQPANRFFNRIISNAVGNGPGKKFAGPDINGSAAYSQMNPDFISIRTASAFVNGAVEESAVTLKIW